MTFRRAILIAAVLSLVAAAPASAKYRVGLGEQNPQMFDSAEWQSMKLKRVRYLVPWDYAKHPAQKAQVDHFMNTARAYRQDVLVTFTARRGCYSEKGRYSKKKSCRAPSPKKYRKAFLAFDKAFPWVRTYSAWNEINHKSQPTFKKPKRAAQYYNVLRKYSVNQINGTDFDPDSIMLYFFPASWTLNGIATKANERLSSIEISSATRSGSCHGTTITIEPSLMVLVRPAM